LADAINQVDLLEAAAADATRRVDVLEAAAADATRRVDLLEAAAADATSHFDRLAADAAERDRQFELQRSQWVASQRRAEDLADRLGEQSRQAMALRAEIDALRSSWSWRVTRPLRWGWGVVLRGSAAVGRAAAPAMHVTIEALRAPVSAAMKMVLRDPLLSARVNQRLLRYPALHRQLVDIARRAGLVAIPPAAAIDQAPVATAELIPPAAGVRMRRPLNGDETDIDELLLRIDDELVSWRGSRR
jgi:O-antigen chain-terminating methyltransferase